MFLRLALYEYLKAAQIHTVTRIHVRHSAIQWSNINISRLKLIRCSAKETFYPTHKTIFQIDMTTSEIRWLPAQGYKYHGARVGRTRPHPAWASRDGDISASMEHRFYSNNIINFTGSCHSYPPTAEHLCYNAVAQQNHIKICMLYTYTSVLPRTSRTITSVSNPRTVKLHPYPKMLHYGTKCQLYDTGCTSCKIRS